MTEVVITDPADARLDDYRTLRDPELRKRYENQRGVFIAEGPNVVSALLTSAYPTRSVLVTPQRRAAFGDRLDGHRVFVAEREVVEAVVRFPLHQGAIAVGDRIPPRSVEEVVAGARVVAVLEAMNDPENLGALFRSARALGVDAVLLGPRCADPLYRRSVRVSMGHVLHLPHAPMPDLVAGLGVLSAAGFTIGALATGPGAERAAAWAARVREGRVAVLLGAEGPGLSAAALAAADDRVVIPMRHEVDSLNVTVAGAIAFALLGPAAG